MDVRQGILVAILAGFAIATPCRAQHLSPDQEAKQRYDAIRYLGSSDCSNSFEATRALCASLRLDRYEENRIEAAVSIGKSCRGNQLAITFLQICAAGSAKDGNPAEKSERVRRAAAEALARCTQAPTEVERKKNGVINADEKKIETSENNVRVANLSREQVMAHAREVLAGFQAANKADSSGNAYVAAITPRRDSVSAIVGNAIAPAQTKPGQSNFPLVAGVTKALTGRQEVGNHMVTVNGDSKSSVRESADARPQITAPARIESK